MLKFVALGGKQQAFPLILPLLSVSCYPYYPCYLFHATLASLATLLPLLPMLPRWSTGGEQGGKGEDSVMNQHYLRNLSIEVLLANSGFNAKNFNHYAFPRGRAGKLSDDHVKRLIEHIYPDLRRPFNAETPSRRSQAPSNGDTVSSPLCSPYREEEDAQRQPFNDGEEEDGEEGEVPKHSTDVVEKNHQGAFCALCGAIGSHHIETCPDRTHKERGKCMICGEAHAIRNCPQKKVNPNKKEGKVNPRKRRERGGKRIGSEKTSGGTRQERSPSPSPDGDSNKAGRYAAYLEGGDRARSPDNNQAGWARGGDDGEGAAPEARAANGEGLICRQASAGG